MGGLWKCGFFVRRINIVGVSLGSVSLSFVGNVAGRVTESVGVVSTEKRRGGVCFCASGRARIGGDCLTLLFSGGVRFVGNSGSRVGFLVGGYCDVRTSGGVGRSGFCVLVRSTVGVETDSVRVRPGDRQAGVEFEVSKSLELVGGVRGDRCRVLMGGVGIGKGVGVSSGLGTRSKGVSFFDGKGLDCSLQMSSLPAICKRGVIVEVLCGERSLLSVRGLGFASCRGRGVGEVLSFGGKVMIVGNPAKDKGSAALCTLLGSVSGSNVGVDAVRSPVRFRLSKMARAGMGRGIGLAFSAKLGCVLERSPSMVLVNRVESRRATGVTMETSVAKRGICSAVRTGGDSGVFDHLLSVKIRGCLLSRTLGNIVARELIEALYRGYGRRIYVGSSGCGFLEKGAVFGTGKYVRYGCAKVGNEAVMSGMAVDSGGLEGCCGGSRGRLLRDYGGLLLRKRVSLRRCVLFGRDRVLGRRIFT